MSSHDSRLWHPFADMSAVRHDEFVVERGEGVWIFDERGRRYLDATASLWYANVGHGRAEIAAAIADQLGRIAAYSAFGDFANRPALELAERLCELAPGKGWRAFLASGGGDGVETAAKLARRYFEAVGEPRRLHLISRTSGYHGTHGIGTALSGIPANRSGFGTLVAEATQVTHDSIPALQEAFERIGPDRVAAVFVEPVIGAGGLHPPEPGYLERVQELCRLHGALFVADAVICGFGRLGTWFGVERFGLRPDLIVFAKGVTSGYLPLGGVMVSAPVAEPFFAAGGPAFRHGATYAAHPTCCAAALANLRILEDEDLLGRSRELEGPLHEALLTLADHPLVHEVRGGVGLLGAVELSPALLRERPGAVAEVFRATRRRGVIVRALGAGLAVSPPLTIQAPQLEQIAETLGEALDELHGTLAGAARAGVAGPPRTAGI